MVQIVATLASLLLAMLAMAIIALSLAEDWNALKRALALSAVSRTPPLPPHTRKIMLARRARIVRMTAAGAPVRAAA